jgi:hypothetical protein
MDFDLFLGKNTKAEMDAKVNSRTCLEKVLRYPFFLAVSCALSFKISKKCLIGQKKIPGKID